MINFKKLLAAEKKDSPIEPRALYLTLARQKGYEYLRGVQEDVLEQWFGRRNQPDLVIKMNTGSGKTIVGLLILQSSLNERKGPAMYLCPDLQLVRQVMEQSKVIGVPCVEFGADDVPVAALNSKAILVTTVQKVFNGLTKFGLIGSPDAVRINSILIDDAHTCLVRARQSFTARIPRGEDLGRKLFALFQGAIRDQSLGVAAEVADGAEWAYMSVPYWSWFHQLSEVADLLSSARDTEPLRFTWPFLRNCLEDCYCIVSGDQIEIAPRSLPVEQIPAFHGAQRRVYMSATLVDDSSLVRDFDARPESVQRPLRPKTTGDIGERMIIVPGLIRPEFDGPDMVKFIARVAGKHQVNVVVLVPSAEKAKKWEEVGATVAWKENIAQCIEQLLTSRGNFFVLLNRYDGIDLPEDACRVLVMDGLPSWSSLWDRYVSSARSDSRILVSQMIQRVEQGLGRAVRSQGDYCIAIVLGKDLVSRMSLVENRAFMTPETAAQIDMGLEFAGMLGEEGTKSLKALEDLMRVSLSRDADWVEYHKAKLLKAVGNSSIEPSGDQGDPTAVRMATAERAASRLLLARRYADAASAFSTLIDDDHLSDSEKGWFMQQEATYLYRHSPDTAFEKQLKAHSLNTQLLKPPAGIQYRKVVSKKGDQAHRILRWLEAHQESNAIVASATMILDTLSFGVKAQQFEPALVDLARLLGYSAQRPDEEFGVGPDVLWSFEDGQYFLLEAKSAAELDRPFISKKEAGQINQHLLWFQQTYTGQTAIPVFVHPTQSLSQEAYVPEGTRVMLPKDLKRLVDATRRFVSALASRRPTAWKDVEVTRLLHEHQLDANSIRAQYVSPVKR